METINVTIPSTIEHLSQIIAGFLLLNPQDWRVELENASRDPENPFHDLPVLLEADIRPDIGYIRDMLCDYIVHVKNGIITPEVDNNWKITGNDWDEALHDQAVQLLTDGILTIPQAKDGWLQNLCSITEEDVRQAAGK